MKFISETPLIFVLLFLAIAIALALFLYSDKEKKKYTKNRWILVSLRALGLFLIGILFLGLFIQTTKNKDEKPILINLIDQSASMLNFADSSKVKNQIEAYLNAIDNKYADKFTIKNYRIGDETSSFKELNFTDSKTNLSQPFSAIQQQFYGNNIGAVTLISDGNYNDGEHPLYFASQLQHVPVYTLGVGDTITKKDVIIRAVQSNEFVFLNNLFPVEALIESNKIGNRTTQVRLVHQGKTIQSKSVTFTNSSSFYKVNFEVEAKTKGIQHYQVIVDGFSDEYTTKNNQQGFYIEVIDDVRKILLLASAPHPDVAALKSVLEEEKNNQITIKTVTDWDQNASAFDLILYHDPLVGPQADLVTKIIQQKCPLFLILGAQSNFRKNYNSFLGMEYTAFNQTDDNTPVFNTSFDLFELSKETKQMFRYFPPLRSVFGRMKLSPNAKVAIHQGVGEVQKEEAQLFFHTQNELKIGILLGEGIWKWKLANYKVAENTDAFAEIFQKSIQYLTVKKNNSPFRVIVPKRSKANEVVLIKAEVYNASMELITQPIVDFKLIESEKINHQYSFSVVDNYYSLNLGKLKAGNYTWTASTKIDGKLHQLSGELVIEANDIELIENTANHQVLIQLAEQTTGEFYPLAQYEKLLKTLDTREDLVPIERQDKTVKNLIDFWWLILLIVATFGTEWFIRRYSGNY